MGTTYPQAHLRNARLPLWLASIANLGVAFLQVALFLPGMVEGRAFDVTLPLAYRMDSLSLTFGVVWALALSLAAATLASVAVDWSDSRHNSRWIAWSICLMSLGLLSIAYSRNLLSLYVGWEVAGLAVWLALRPMWHGGGHKRWLLLALHAPGWVLLAVLTLGLVVPLAPPSGGIALPWPLPVAVAFAVVVLARSGCWPLHAWARIAAEASGDAGALLLGLYCMAAPYLLAKALVAAPWEATGIWALTLLGTLGLLGNVVTSVGLRGAARIPAIASAQAAASLLGFGMSSGSPLAAMGAVVLLLSSTLCVIAMTWAEDTAWGWISVMGGWSTLLGSSVGVWAIAQGALGLRYGIVAALLLPAGAMMLLDDGQRTTGKRRKPIVRPSSFVLRLLLFGVFAFAGLYPQGLVEWLLRPTVGAMAGGVGALRYVSSEWGVGLLVSSSEETVLAALPATGIALAVALALIALQWLVRLVRHVI